MNFPETLRYTDDHEWIRLEGEVGWIGITDYAQGELGDIVYVELPAVGTRVERGKPMGTIEAVKAVADLYAPLSGEVLEVNAEVQNGPELINKDPYGAGWMVKLRVDDPAEAEHLHNAESYRKLVGK